MRRLLLFAPLLLLFIAADAGRPRLRKEKPATYPNGLSDSARKVFVADFQRGQVLYDLNCGGCHNMQVDGRTVIPDFSLPQLLDYEMRSQYPEHQDRVRESDVSVEELDDIQTFLHYRKRSGVPVAPLPHIPDSQRE